MVRDMTTSSGDWDWSRLVSLLPSGILDQIVAVPPPNENFSTDTLGWRWNDNMDFSISSAYDFLMSNNLHPSDAVWKRIWTLEVSQRVRVFLWVTLHQRHLTNAERFRRHLAPSAHSNRVLADDWNCRFAILCWLLWKDRCDNIFNSVDSNREGLLIRGNRLLDECKDWQLVFRYVPRSLNRLADRLAALGRLSSREGITLPVPPTDLVSLVEEESESADPALLVAHNWGSAESVVYFNINV
ncbi:hypothetical protein V6N12_074626 [Hibiscus sabdariffa]|uniref:Reverse transcriptase zinc-binding domain-containing protein n=1 Tax=Hibiscus sabdariffa TaxID=183260 RepID=A0ABR2BXT7_9ROSI